MKLFFTKSNRKTNFKFKLTPSTNSFVSNKKMISPAILSPEQTTFNKDFNNNFNKK